MVNLYNQPAFATMSVLQAWKTDQYLCFQGLLFLQLHAHGSHLKQAYHRDFKRAPGWFYHTRLTLWSEQCTFTLVLLLDYHTFYNDFGSIFLFRKYRAAIFFHDAQHFGTMFLTVPQTVTYFGDACLLYTDHFWQKRKKNSCHQSPACLKTWDSLLLF